MDEHRIGPKPILRGVWAAEGERPAPYRRSKSRSSWARESST